jgi:hypothetical protein
MTQELETFDLEAVYDAEIAPLMAQILDVCKRHRMPMFATFIYRDTEDSADLCTSMLKFDGRTCDMVDAALGLVRRGPRPMFRVTTRAADGTPLVDEVIL